MNETEMLAAELHALHDENKRLREANRALQEDDVLLNGAKIREDIRSLRAEVEKWKDEYENVCKFATDYEEQRDALRLKVGELASTLERKIIYYTGENARLANRVRALEEKVKP